MEKKNIYVYASKEWHKNNKFKIDNSLITSYNRYISNDNIDFDSTFYKKVYSSLRSKGNEWAILVGNNWTYDKEIVDKIIENFLFEQGSFYCGMEKFSLDNFNSDNIIICLNIGQLKRGKAIYPFKTWSDIYKNILHIMNNIPENFYFINKNKEMININPEKLKDRIKKQKINTLSNTESFDLIVNKLNSNIPFSYCRFGDADYMMMLKESVGKTVGSNNKFFVTKDLQKELIESHNIKNNDYLLGSVLSITNKNKLYSYTPFLNSYSGKVEKLPIVFDDMISAVALTETFYSDINKFKNFSSNFKNRKVMFVGAYYHENLKYLYGPNIKYFVKTPSFNSFSKINSIYKEIMKNIDNVDTIIFSTGQTSRVIIKRLWKLGYYSKTIMDVGSLSDYAILDTNCEKLISIRRSIKRNNNIIKNNFKELKNI